MKTFLLLIGSSAMAVAFTSCRTRGDFGVEKLGMISPPPADTRTPASPRPVESISPLAAPQAMLAAGRPSPSNSALFRP